MIDSLAIQSAARIWNGSKARIVAATRPIVSSHTREAMRYARKTVPTLSSACRTRTGTQALTEHREHRRDERRIARSAEQDRRVGTGANGQLPVLDQAARRSDVRVGVAVERPLRVIRVRHEHRHEPQDQGRAEQEREPLAL